MASQTHPAPGAPLPVEGPENVRELGGWPAADGRRVRHGLFYRSGALCEIRSPADKALFAGLGIRVICDLRSSMEREALPDPEVPGIVRHDISAILDEAGREINYDPREFARSTPAQLSAVAHSMGSIYARLPFGNEAYRAMFREIQNRRLPLLFHCSAGKDRTGVAAALILLALGASRGTAAEDFMLTNQCRPRETARLAQRMAAQLAADPGFAPYMQAIGGVLQKNLDAALDAILARYGSFEAYFAAEYGLNADALARLRADCLE